MTIGLVSFSCCHVILVQLRVGVALWVKWNGLKWPAKPWSKDCCKSKTVNCMAHWPTVAFLRFYVFFCLLRPSLFEARHSSDHPWDIQGPRDVAIPSAPSEASQCFPCHKVWNGQNMALAQPSQKRPCGVFLALLRSSARWLVKPGGWVTVRLTHRWGSKNGNRIRISKSSAAKLLWPPDSGKGLTFQNNMVNSAKM